MQNIDSIIVSTIQSSTLWYRQQNVHSYEINVPANHSDNTEYNMMTYVEVIVRNLSWPAVSQICSFTLSPSMSNVRILKSTPIVVIYVPAENTHCHSLYNKCTVAVAKNDAVSDVLCMVNFWLFQMLKFHQFSFLLHVVADWYKL